MISLCCLCSSNLVNFVNKDLKTFLHFQCHNLLTNLPLRKFHTAGVLHQFFPDSLIMVSLLFANSQSWILPWKQTFQPCNFTEKQERNRDFFVQSIRNSDYWLVQLETLKDSGQWCYLWIIYLWAISRSRFSKIG